MKKKTLLDKLNPIVAQLQELQQQAFEIYKPQVESLIHNKVSNENTIQHLLDGMLDFCGDNDMLVLYKKTCRYYWEINAQATADYINYYRKMWDSEEHTDNES